MLKPSLEEFSFSDDDVPLFASTQKTISASTQKTVFSPTQKQTNAGNDIGVGCSGIGLERVSNQNKDRKTSLMDKGTMTENVNQKKAEKTRIFVEKATMTDYVCSLEPLKRLRPTEDGDEAHESDFDQSEEMKDHKAVPNYQDYVKRDPKVSYCETEQKPIGTKIKTESKDTQSRICPHCGFEAKTRSSLRIHKMTHDDSLKVKCDECDHKTLDGTRLKFHKAKEHGGAEVPCSMEDCNFKSSKTNELRYHRSTTHRNVIHSCSSCHYTTKFLTNLKSHGIIHLEKKFLCSECDYRSRTEKLLTIHINFEHKNIRFSCQKCEKEFSTVTLLKEHTRVKHEGLKLVCHSCGYATAWTSRLKKHVMTCHEGVRFDCSKCTKAFSDFSSLKVHSLSVHENAIYPCGLCDFKATRKVYLRRHVKNKHLQITYDCVGCSYKAARKHHLNQHYKSRQLCANNLMSNEQLFT